MSTGPQTVVVHKPTPQVFTPFAEEVLRLFNENRLANNPNARPLAWNQALMIAALKQAKWMAERVVTTHTGDGGTQSGERIRAAGYQGTPTGEIVLYSGGGLVAIAAWSSATVVTKWMSSPGHRANIIRPEFTEVGFGYFYSGSEASFLHYHYCATFGGGVVAPAAAANNNAVPVAPVAGANNNAVPKNQPAPAFSTLSRTAMKGTP
jgi:uncharacterized protein YkwD